MTAGSMKTVGPERRKPHELHARADERTRAILDHRHRTATVHRRGWLMRRMLLVADVVGLAIAFFATQLLFGSPAGPDPIAVVDEIALFLAALPVWVMGAKVFGLYDGDEERADHSTVDDLVRVFLLMTVGTFLVTRLVGLARAADPDFLKLTVFWALAIVSVTTARIAARTVARRSISYIQNAVVVGAGDIGQLVARKVLQHREYGINVVGFVDSEPKDLRPDVRQLRMLGPLEELPEIVRLFDVDRVIFAFSRESHDEFLPLIRGLRDSGVQDDIVPRFFEIIGPKVEVHTLEGLPVIGLSPVKLSRSSQLMKRGIDVVVAALALVATAPLFLLIALLIKRDSQGPVFFRQTRLGKNMREFTLLKFRTMKVGTGDAAHRAYIADTMTAAAAAGDNGLYKLEREDAVTRVGRWLRKTSLDEMPQLINVLKGDMSLVGPRPCLPYEVDGFATHHFERFLVPAGMTGLWQVRARAHSTFGEALDLDVLYAQSWSLGLDLTLLARTPLQILRSRGTA